MKRSDWKYSGIGAVALLGIAATIVFAIRPGGFEGRIAWFFLLLPGAYVLAVIAGHVPVSAFRSPWPIIFVVSFLWYFAISCAAIKTYRLVSSRFFGQSPD
jgi:hypothetical protein